MLLYQIQQCWFILKCNARSMYHFRSIFFKDTRIFPRNVTTSSYYEYKCLWTYLITSFFCKRVIQSTKQKRFILQGWSTPKESKPGIKAVFLWPRLFSAKTDQKLKLQTPLVDEFAKVRCVINKVKIKQEQKDQHLVKDSLFHNLRLSYQIYRF